ncbi:MAG: sulfatase [Verrucomicrobiota bacterium JB022]|nr:sulfatase [Verrucomicrobiota bacterium JB022]
MILQRFKLSTGTLALCLLWSAGGLRAETAPERPNILFIVTDDMRPEIGSYGSELAVTPHLDALSESSVIFSRAYAQQAVCNPSRTSFLTGLRPDTVRVWDLDGRFREVHEDIVSLPEYLKQNGYYTRAIGKIFHNETAKKPNRAPMADPQSWSAPSSFINGAHWQDSVVPGDPFGPEAKGGAYEHYDVPDEAYFDGQIAAVACAALKDRAEVTEPFFLAVGFWKPHLPFNVPQRYWDLYDRADFDRVPSTDFPENVPEVARHRWTELRSYGGMPKQGPLSHDEVLALRHGYFACISFVDAQVGKVLAQLKATGLDDNTIVIFFSDHGFHLGEHELWGKTTNYELDARVPLIVHLPERYQGKSGQADGLVELIDLFPSICEMAGLPAPAALEGKSFVPLLNDPSLPGKTYVLSQHPQPFYSRNWQAMGYALRTEQYRYVEWRDCESGELIGRELYDHRTDPAETDNLIDRPDYRETVHSMETLAKDAYHFNPDQLVRYGD